MCRIILGVVLFLHLGFAAPTPALAQVTALSGLDSIYVWISVTIDDDAKHWSVTERETRTKVELELRRAGVPIATERGAPSLKVDVTVLPTAAGGFAYHVNLAIVDLSVRTRDLFRALFDPKGLTTNAIILSVTRDKEGSFIVWNHGQLGTTDRPGARNHFMDSLQSLINEFLNDYLSANPKQ